VKSHVVYTFSSGNISRRNIARSYWCAMILAIAAVVIAVIAGVNVANLLSYIPFYH
jgi:hypothetical protein